METLVNGNVIFIFFFTIIAIFNYTNLLEYQRIVIIYMTVYALVFSEIIGSRLAIVLLMIAMFCFLEILTSDEKKFKILVRPTYKIADCLYLSIFQYHFMKIAIAIILCSSFIQNIPYIGNAVAKIISIIFLIWAITKALQQDFVISSFTDMYKVFSDYPINKVVFNKKLKDACNILISIEDRTYYERTGYTFLSVNAIKCILERRLAKENLFSKVNYILKLGTKFTKDLIYEKRGYSTVYMQLMRSLGVKRGYEHKYRRKIFEFLYSRIFFEGITKMFKKNHVARRENIQDYFIYIYFHQVNTFLGDATFSKFLNAFDMQYGQNNKKDIYDCSNEGIFIACMGLSKRGSLINANNIDYYVGLINNVTLDKEKICQMASKMMTRPFDGNYLK